MDKRKNNKTETKAQSTERSDGYDYYDIKNIASANDFTGMIPTPPLTDADADGYSDIFPVTQQKSVSAQKSATPREQKNHSSIKGSRKK